MAQLKQICIGVAVFYLALLLLVYFMQRSFIYFPPSAPIPKQFFNYHTKAQILPIDLAGVGTLSSIYQPPPNEQAPVIILLHGNASAAHQFSAYFSAFEAWGMGYLAIGWPGYSSNPGKPNEIDILRTGLANYDALIALGIAPERIVIYGESLGAASAIDIAHQRDAAGLILAAPFLSMQAMARKQMPWFPTSVLLKDTYRSDLKMPSITEPLLILHGSADRVIPHSQGKALYGLHMGNTEQAGNTEQGNKQFILIKNGQHQLWSQEVAEHIKQAIVRFVG